MNIKQIEGATHNLGKSQGFLGLPVRQDKMSDGTPMMVTAWEPLPDEIERINAGASVILSLIGTVVSPGHPPVFIGVASAPDDMSVPSSFVLTQEFCESVRDLTAAGFTKDRIDRLWKAIHKAAVT